MTASKENCEMLPCPLCGRQPDYQHFNVSQNTRGRIICTCGLGLTQGRNDTEEGTILKWNTRSDHAVQAANERKAEQAIAATVGTNDASMLRAKVKAQSDHINKLRGEYKALDEQMERHCTEYRATIRKLKAELDAATVGEEHEMHICKRCGVAYELNIIDKGFGKPRFCPNCGFKEMYQ